MTRGRKDPAAVSLGRRGGKARAKALSPEERTASARKAATARTRQLSPEKRREIAQRAARARWSHQRRGDS